MYRKIYDYECVKEVVIFEKYSIFWFIEYEKFNGNDIEIRFLYYYEE